MPSLGSIPFHHKSLAGEEMQFIAACTVDSKGVFAIVIPDDLADVASGLGFAVTRPRTNWRVEHRDLETAKTQVRLALEEFLKCEESVERVIRYSTDLRVSFWQNQDGTIAPSGRGSNGGNWSDVGNKLIGHAGTHNGYGVGIVAWVVDRVTLTRGPVVKVEYRRADLGHHTPKEGLEYAYQLNSFVRMGIPKDLVLTDMPYTEQAAKFFHDILISLCLMARNVDGFFKSPDALRLAIEKQQPLLLNQS